MPLKPGLRVYATVESSARLVSTRPKPYTEPAEAMARAASTVSFRHGVAPARAEEKGAVGYQHHARRRVARSQAGDSVSLHDDRRDDEYREMPQDLGNNISYLNDSSEGVHLLGMIRKRLPELLEKHHVNDSVLERLDYTDTEIEDRPSLHRSRRMQLAAQWRSYCPNGNGVASAFEQAAYPKAYKSRKTSHPDLVSSGSRKSTTHR